ncbi:MAG: hypothetical protein KF870_05095 [Leadbetterella sp.]|nr:hypothetical protein [Leadbetterella sp.]
MKTILTLLGLWLCISCASVKKELDNGRYKQAVDLAVSKLKGKKKKSPKFVLGLEEAYEYYLQEKLTQADNLKRKAAEGTDLKILKIYEEIESVQASIRPLLPLTDKNGYKADIQLMDVSAELAQYRNKAADFLYTGALDNLEKAAKGDKTAAREAYSALKQMENIAGGTSHIRKLQEEAKTLGTTHILLETEISPKISLSKAATGLFRDLGSENLNKTWQTLHLSADRRQKLDYEVTLVLNDFVISPEKESTREYQDKKEIEEEAGSSSRNNEKIKRKVEVKADVIELYRFKEAVVKGQLIIYDRNARKELYNQEVNAVQTFENYASTFKGDKRALSDVSRKRIGGKPIPFPTNEQILADALALLKKDMLAKAASRYSAY